MSRTAARRLTGLAVTRGPRSLIPPYSHTTHTATPAPALSPPYAHHLEAHAAKHDSALAPHLRFAILETSAPADKVQVDEWAAWADAQLSSEEGRGELWKAWLGAIIGLEQARGLGAQIPEIPFHSLAGHLENRSTITTIRDTGSLVVRNVVPDDLALDWAREIASVTSARRGHPVFWHEALLEARGHPSVLSANNQILAAFGEPPSASRSEESGASEPALTRIASIADSLASAPAPAHTHALADVTRGSWPVTAHLVLAPAPPTSRTLIPASSHAATYATLRPLFVPIQSRLSFYHPEGYLDPSNWRLVERASASPLHAAAHGSGSHAESGPHAESGSHSEVGSHADSGSHSEAGSHADSGPRTSALPLPHLEGKLAQLPSLSPGDMVFRHAAIPTTGGEGGAVLEVSPMQRDARGHQVASGHRAAFERGIPPPEWIVSGEMVALEAEGVPEMLGSKGARMAMGYE